MEAPPYRSKNTAVVLGGMVKLPAAARCRLCFTTKSAMEFLKIRMQLQVNPIGLASGGFGIKFQMPGFVNGEFRSTTGLFTESAESPRE